MTSCSLCVVPTDPAGGSGIHPYLGAIAAFEIRPGVVWATVRSETRVANITFAVRPWHRRVLEEALAVSGYDRAGEACSVSGYRCTTRQS